MSGTAILAIDQGTTSTRTMAFSPGGNVIASAQQEFPQIYPHEGWVEHDPEAIWDTTLSTLREVYKTLKSKNLTLAGIGITNQRETTLVWDKTTGKPIYNAIVWQDRRTARECEALKADYTEDKLADKTGLLFDPYFSASKIAWILDNVDGARDKAARGELAFGTVDTFLISRLTDGTSHVTDATNASRTNLFNIKTQMWDAELLDLFNVPEAVLPKVLDCAADFGTTASGILDENLPILGVAGDQQAAAIGQCCVTSGTIKSTYGTGCFVIMNTGAECVRSKNRLLSTVAYRLDGQTSYALEGSIFIAGAAVQWLRDEVGFIKDAKDTEDILKNTPHPSGVYVVPAFTGLGAPYWDPDARGAIFGLTRGTTSHDLIRATLESVCYQTDDLFQAMADDGPDPSVLRVDGGMVANNTFVQLLSDTINLPIDRPEVMETTALGAAYLVGLKAGLYEDLTDLSKNWNRDAHFEPAMDARERTAKLEGWSKAVERVLTLS